MTPNDLSQIRTVFKEEIHQEVKKVVEDVLEQKLEPIRKELKTVNKKLIQLHKDDETIIGFLDREITDTKKRVDRIENHLHLPSPTL